jgi:hypothetical protein
MSNKKPKPFEDLLREEVVVFAWGTKVQHVPHVQQPIKKKIVHKAKLLVKINEQATSSH